MKKILFAAMAALAVTACGNKQVANNQEAEAADSVVVNGKLTSYQMDGFRFHVYDSGDVMGDASFIVEGDSAVVLMEAPLFKDGDAEFQAFVDSIGKPVETVVMDYHEGKKTDIVSTLPEGMKQFMKGEVYGGMMAGFKQNWGDTMVELADTINGNEVKWGSTVSLAGVDFTFLHGAASDFPGATIVIGGQVALTHWAPAQAHVSPLQVGSLAAIDAELEATKAEQQTGAKLFVGGHGGATTPEAVQFKIDYLEALKTLAAENKTAEAFAEAVRAAYPDLQGDVDALAAALYKK